MYVCMFVCVFVFLHMYIDRFIWWQLTFSFENWIQHGIHVFPLYKRLNRSLHSDLSSKFRNNNKKYWYLLLHRLWRTSYTVSQWCLPVHRKKIKRTFSSKIASSKVFILFSLTNTIYIIQLKLNSIEKSDRETKKRKKEKNKAPKVGHLNVALEMLFHRATHKWKTIKPQRCVYTNMLSLCIFRHSFESRKVIANQLSLATNGIWAAALTNCNS